MSLSRRALLQLAGLAALPSLARAENAVDGWEEAVHARALETPPSPLRDDERALISAIADGIIPRTDTPGALDVGAVGFVEVIVAEWMTEAELIEFRGGLSAIDRHAARAHGRSWPALDAAQREVEFAFLEDTSDPALEERRAYRRLRGHVLHGYLTSERVRRDVLKVNITPGHYRGDVPVPARGGRDD
jgi:gluconate 2-dehydrogenase gamma chain